MRPNEFLDQFVQGSILPMRQHKKTSKEADLPLVPRFQMIKTGGFKLKSQS